MNARLKTMVHVALLIALEVVLSRFASIATPIAKIGFAFVPIAICAMMYGPLWAGAAGAIADFIGANMFPIGPYFFGFTISAALTGVIYGVFLYKKKEHNTLHIAGAAAANSVLISLMLTTFWISLISGSTYFALLPTRLLQAAVMIPVQFIVLRLLYRPVEIYTKKQYA